LDDWKVGLISGIWAPICGVAVALFVGLFVDLSDQQYAMLIIFSALPPAVLNYLLAEQLKFEPEKIASIVLTGNMVSALSIPIVLAFVL
ncbi:AEC family transporter, partial [Oleiphilus sp. HI0080]